MSKVNFGDNNKNNHKEYNVPVTDVDDIKPTIDEGIEGEKVEKPKADVLDLLLAKDLGEFKVESTQVEISRLSELLGEKFIIELRVLPPAVSESIEESTFSYGYDEDGKLDLDIRTDEQRVKTLIEATYTLDGKQLFKQQSLRRKFGVRTNEDLVKKLLLSGEVDKLYKRYQTLAGYVKTSVVDVKN